MASASSSSAKTLFADCQTRFSERVKMNVKNIASLARQMNRGSKSTETLMHAARNFVLQENAIQNTENNLKRLQMINTQMDHQLKIITKNAIKLEEVKEQVTSMQR